MVADDGLAAMVRWGAVIRSGHGVERVWLERERAAAPKEFGSRGFGGHQTVTIHRKLARSQFPLSGGVSRQERDPTRRRVERVLLTLKDALSG